MSASLPLWSMPLSDVQALDVVAWRRTLLGRLSEGARMITLYGRREGARAHLTAVLEDAPQRLSVWRTTADVEPGYHNLTEDVPALHCFEREIHEQTGLHVRGHPWLKPVRFGGGSTQAAEMDAYPFYTIAGKEVHEVNVGPIHAGVIEPGAFRFMCHGEQVHHLEIHLGYQHRGVEALLLARDPRTLTPLVETIAGDTSVAHAWAYAAALESLAGVAIEPVTEVARGVMLELERVAMHLAGLSGLAADVAFLQGASTYGRLRTTAINASMKLCGSRFGRRGVRPGTNPLRLDERTREDVLGALTLLETDLPIIDECFLEARTVQHRLLGVGAVSRELALELGMVGMAARASGVAIDQREGAGGIYAALPAVLHTEPSGDCWARARLRVTELYASLAWVRAALELGPRWIEERQPIGALLPAHLTIAMVEGWRGEVVHALETDDRGEFVHYKVQDPSLRNWMGLALAVRGNDISDFPICNKSFDLSYCGSDL